MSTLPSRRTRRPRWRLTAAAAAVALTALAGCSSAVGGAGSGDAAAPRDGGVLRLGVSTDLQPATPFSNALTTAKYEVLASSPLTIRASKLPADASSLAVTMWVNDAAGLNALM